MAFIRAKTRQRRDGTRTFYYVMQSYREEGRVRQQVIAYLGRCPTVETAICETASQMLFCQTHIDQWRAEAARISEVWKFSPGQAERLAHRRGGAALAKRAAHDLVRLQQQIDNYPKKIAECERQLAKLREAAQLLGITDAEVLLLPGTAALEAMTAEMSNRRFMAGASRLIHRVVPTILSPDK